MVFDGRSKKSRDKGGGSAAVKLPGVIKVELLDLKPKGMNGAKPATSVIVA